jgi:uncharacterized protein
MKFWDASAVVPLLVAEPSTAPLQAVLAKDASMVVWWATEVECVSALARLERDASVDGAAMTQAMARLKALAAGWHEVDASDLVRETAVRYLRVHPLRAADALQLAAAFIVADRRPSSIELVTLDSHLREAADKEGFVLVGPPGLPGVPVGDG